MEELVTTGGVLHSNEYDEIVDTICDVFSCGRDEITEIKALQKGLTNIVLSFMYNGGKYVYRHPGNGSDVLAIRGRESIVQKQIEEAGVDNTLIAMSVDKGWRISRFIESRPFDYHNLNDAVRAMLLLRDLHQVKPKVRWDNDVMRGAARIAKKVPAGFYGSKIDKFVEFDAIKKRLEAYYEMTKYDGISRCLTHGDCRDENFLINDEEIYLIDWEYAGFGDPGYDIGSYVCGGTHSDEEVDRLLFIYLGKIPSEKELRHFYGYIALTGYFYMHWVMYKEACGQKVGYLKDNWYYYADKYSKKAFALYFNK